MKVALLLLFCSLTIVHCSRQFICPNSGSPKVGDDGEEIQCLPGQAAELVCGRGYSCFFSGFNYRCCPTADEDYDDNLHGADCPLGSLNVLDSTGAPVRCNPRTGQCANGKMFCSRQNSNAVCCEHLPTMPPRSTNSIGRTTKPERSQTRTTQAPKRIQPKSTESDNFNLLDLECPENTLTVLGDSGDPFTCKSSKNCPNENMQCYKVKPHISICCESLETAKNKLDDEEEPVFRNLQDEEEVVSNEPNPLKYTPEQVAKVQDELLIQQQLESAIVGKLNKIEEKKELLKIKKEQIKEQKQKKKPRNYADNEDTPRITFDHTSHEKIHKQKTKKIHENPSTTTTTTTSRPKAHGIRTNNHANSDKKDIVEYQPHTQGGYAISRKLASINSRPISPERRAQAQEYIVEQIRQGWPYDEKFYRPENIAVINNRREKDVLHFPQNN